MLEPDPSGRDPVAKQPLHARREGIELERLLEIVEGALAERLDGRLHGRVSGDQDDPHGRGDRA
jgi:hypothetical protein